MPKVRPNTEFFMIAFVRSPIETPLQSQAGHDVDNRIYFFFIGLDGRQPALSCWHEPDPVLSTDTRYLRGRLSIEMSVKPVACQPRHFVQCSGFFEEVRCSRHDHQLLLAAHLRERCPV